VDQKWAEVGKKKTEYSVEINNGFNRT